ncbi:hypothetical protein [Vibrio splendidus]|uniref:hypothetical protein n=1 Tax=Vibrio splendidus TaxID=29497 RepID=UPI000D338028|nr:hypothetical protein [Vibrio splendidus]PTP52735.1 hypothetical protein CWN83_13410 [Vibrio splendidus]
MSTVTEFEFISWDRFGAIVKESSCIQPSISVGRYAKINRYDVKNRLPSAVKELLTLAKLYDIQYSNASSPVKFSYEVIDAIFTTIIVSASERDLILKGQAIDATALQIHEAEELISALRLPETVL